MKTPQKPIPEIAKFLHSDIVVWFKFENKHHFGSHKGRSIPIMIDEYIKLGKTSFVISSSGNAALAALRFVVSHNKNKPGHPLMLNIFIGESISKNKLEKLKKELTENIKLSQVKNPKQESLKYSQFTDSVWLRSSTDPLALIGYQNLSDELEKIPNLAAVFIAASSGTAAEGIFTGLQKIGINPQIHIVQTESCHPLTNYFLEQTGESTIQTSNEKSIADAIVDKIGRRNEAVLKILLNSNGKAWVVSESEIQEATKISCETTSEQITPNGSLPLAGLKKAVLNGCKWTGPVVCIIGGD